MNARPLRLIPPVCLVVFSLLLVADAVAQSDDPFEVLVASDADRLRAESSAVLRELFEQAGDFEGLASTPFELLERVDAVLPSTAALEEMMHRSLTAQLQSSTLAAARAFWESGAGRRVLWLDGESTTASGRSAEARSARHVMGRASPERLARLRELDAAILETRTAAESAARWMPLVQATAERVGAALEEPAEWAQSPDEIHAWIHGQFREEVFRALVFRSSRLDAGDLEEFVTFARSGEGATFFAARRVARLEAAERITKDLLKPLGAGLARELGDLPNDDEIEGEVEREFEGT
ncbi:MAG: hypothetical protein AAGN46_03640 [Acidobacteriota bacterium]